jgi:hypothetical protein
MASSDAIGSENGHSAARGGLEGGLEKNRDNNKLRQVFQFSSHPLPYCSWRSKIIIVSTAVVSLILVEKN